MADADIEEVGQSEGYKCRALAKNNVAEKNLLDKVSEVCYKHVSSACGGFFSGFVRKEISKEVKKVVDGMAVIEYSPSSAATNWQRKKSGL